MRILYLTQTFPPEPGPTKRPLEQAVQLQRLGHRVQVVTAFPSFPHGRVFPGYGGRAWRRERLRGVHVLRVWSVAAPNRGVWRRAASAASFAAAAFLGGLRSGKCDVVIASVPNVGTEWAGWLVARLRGAQFLLEVRDPIPENLALAGVEPGRFLYRGLDRYFRFFYRRADIIAVAGSGMTAPLIRRGARAGRILVWPHAADPEQFDAAAAREFRDQHGLAGKFVVLYAGSFAPQYRTPQLVHAARAAAAANPAVHFVLIGDGPDRAQVEALLREASSDSVTLLAPCEPAAVAWLLQAADVCIAPNVTARPLPYLEGYATTKVCEYLSAGRPVLAVENHPALGPFLEGLGAGWSVPDDPAAIAAAVLRLARDPELLCEAGERAGAHASLHLSRAAVAVQFEKRLVGLLDRLLLERLSAPQPFKRAADIAGSAFALVLTAPLWAAIAVAIRLGGAGPVFFRQERVGQGGGRFRILKFRTMYCTQAGPCVTSPGDERVTRAGRWLRRSKLDELPQLWNVLRGEMSLVGPRPEVPEYVEHYTEGQRRVLAAKPGMTDPATLFFRDEAQWLHGAVDPERTYLAEILPAKLRLSLAYAARATAWSDFLVLVRTGLLVWARRGPTGPAAATPGRPESGPDLPNSPGGRSALPDEVVHSDHQETSRETAGAVCS